MFSLSHIRLIASALAILAIVGAIFFYGNIQYKKGYDARVGQETASRIDAEKTTARIKYKVMRMPKEAIQKELELKWCRDC